MSETETTPSLADLWEAVFRAKLDGVFTSLPGIVQSYNRETQKADVKVAVKVPRRTKAGEVTWHELPILRDVKVVFPCRKGVVFHFDLDADDTVLLHFAMRDFSEWLVSGNVSEPPDTRTHSPSGVVALPGFLTDVNTMSLAIEHGLQMGLDTGAQVLFTGSELRLGATNATKKAARNGDQVQVQIPAGSVIIAASGGTLNPSPITLTGTITEGSNTVKISD